MNRFHLPIRWMFCLIALALLGSGDLAAQRIVPPTDTLHVRGAVKQALTFTLADLDTFPTTAIADVAISNQEGEIKKTVTGLKGFPVKQLLSTLVLPAEKPKFLNEYYFVFLASDGYKVVFSWNEIFNTEAGNHIYIVTQTGGKPLREMEERILVICPEDRVTGRRYIKGLREIIVKRVE